MTDHTQAEAQNLATRRELSREEKSLLLYFESQAVEYGGKLQSARMNEQDFGIAKRWNESGFVRFGRIAFKDINQKRDTSDLYPRTHWCVLSEEAWQIAHAERRARCQRVMDTLTVQRLGLTQEAA